MSTLEFDPEGDKTFRIPVQAHDQETLTSPVMNIIDGEVVVSSSHYTTLIHQARIAAAADNMIQYIFFFFLFFGENKAWHFMWTINFLFFFFFQKIGFDILCKLSPWETVCMKGQTLFSGRSK